MILFKQHRFGGFVTDLGGVTSHTAIVARSLGIPAIVGLHHARQTDPRGRAADRRRRAGRGDRQPRPAGARRVPRCARRSSASSAQKLKRLKRRRRRRSTARRSSCTPTSSCPRTSRRRSTPAPTGVGPLPQRVPVPEPQRPARRGRAVRGLPRGRRRRWRQAGRDPHARPRRRQGARRRRHDAQTCPTRRWACARSASASPSRRCSSPSCARSCAPRTTARCGSCCRCSRTRTRSTRRSRCIRQAKQQLDERGMPLRPRGRDRRHDRGAGGGARAADLHAAARLPVDRHQRPDPVHARDRPHRRRGGAPLRPAAPGGADAGRRHHPDRARAAACRSRCAARWRATCSSRACCSASACASSRCTRRSCSTIKQRILRTNLAEVQALAQRVLRASDPAKTRELLARLNA